MSGETNGNEDLEDQTYSIKIGIRRGSEFVFVRVLYTIEGHGRVGSLVVHRILYLPVIRPLFPYYLRFRMCS